MARYIVNAPDGVSVSVSCNFGNLTLKHGDESSNEGLALQFPHIFIKMKEPEVKIEEAPAVEEVKDEAPAEEIQEVQEVVESVIEEIQTEEAPEEIVEEEASAEEAVEEVVESPKSSKKGKK
mgnify:CR=1 FL=1